ncbi:extender of chronological lifespan protein Ecl3 [Schizosaccharomyces pombe]|uniref:Extender of the chronological lifespan protein ecl3 n=1 Tax=Schizosaccharomyces pombe (strain 972 / ATCC 24843) TaxID=284812 RepID=ECL3_SCHPO|nr:protein Ecl3 [Schizosaccharomyces pombe]C6Y4C3.1 RecName: Full=Extender of the chronological lifespan protein ecl3 [Schizosaccharomyces pombe 972h-]CBA11513.1 extender of the chronological lifespan protein Ecl3 [Schizosaccharomyces pombe]|eukprot:NP_001343088.1 protein Ecl3 [Schizosaccharomyces pombe]
MDLNLCLLCGNSIDAEGLYCSNECRIQDKATTELFSDPLKSPSLNETIDYLALNYFDLFSRRSSMCSSSNSSIYSGIYYTELKNYSVEN